MKHWIAVLTLALAVLGLASACRAKHVVDPGRLAATFANAPQATKDIAVKAIESIKTQNYQEAVSSLARVVEKGDLSKEQKQAIADTLVDIQVVVTENKAPNLEELLRAIEELSAKVM